MKNRRSVCKRDNEKIVHIAHTAGSHDLFQQTLNKDFRFSAARRRRNKKRPAGICNCGKLPRVKDFRGLSKSKFDGRGNYAFGVKEHLIFPEISVDKIDAIRGMDIVIATTAKTDDEARALLTKIGLPLVLK